MIENPALLSRSDAAQFLGLAVSSIDLLIARGELRARRLGRRVLVPHAELVKFSKSDHGSIWPAKVNGRTTRNVRVATGYHQ
jgi:excisionase family DNA binding protein